MCVVAVARYLVSAVFHLLLRAGRLSRLDAVLVVLRLQLSVGVHPGGVPHGVHLADDDAGVPALRVHLSRAEGTPAVHRSHLRSHHRRHLRRRRAVAAVPVLREQLHRSDIPLARREQGSRPAQSNYSLRTRLALGQGC